MNDQESPMENRGSVSIDGSRRFAAIDIGTVTCRMLVADVLEDPAETEGWAGCGVERIDTVAKEYAVVNLGEGVDSMHRLSAAAISRTLAAIDGFLELRNSLDTPEYPVLGTMVVATSASRDAENAEEFAGFLSERDLSLSVIPGEKEAALSFAGATVGYGGKTVAVVDVGGGSTEISIGEGEGVPKASHSFNIGCRRMTERFLKSYPPTNESVEAAREWVREEVRGWIEGLGGETCGFGGAQEGDGEVRNGGEIPGFGDVQEGGVREFGNSGAQGDNVQEVGARVCNNGGANNLTMIAVAGTATSAVSMREHMEVYDSSRVHGSSVSKADMQELFDRTSRMTLPELENIVGLDPRRAPVIVSGIIILQEIMNQLGADSFIASESDILQGMIMDQAKSQANQVRE